MYTKTPLLILAITLLASACAHAAIITHEGFSDYTASDALNDLNGGTGWGDVAWSIQDDVTNWTVANASPLTYTAGGQTLSSTPNYGSMGGSYKYGGRSFDASPTSVWNAAGYVSEPWNAQMVDKGVVYISFLYRRNVTKSVSMGLTELTNVPPQNAVNGNRAIVRIAETGEYSLYYRSADNKDPALDFTTAAIGVSNTVGTTDLIVMKMDMNDGTAASTISVWVNPPSLAGAEPTPTLTVTDATSGTGGTPDRVYGIGFRSFMVYPGNGVGDGSVDELRFGESFADVTPVATGAVEVPVGVDVAIAGADVELTFDSVNGQSYQLLVSTNDMASFAPVAGATGTGDGNPMTLTDTGGAPASGDKVFYKVDVN